MSNRDIDLRFEIDETLFKEGIAMWSVILKDAYKQKSYSPLTQAVIWIVVFLVALVLFRMGMPSMWVLSFFLGAFAALACVHLTQKVFEARLFNKMWERSNRDGRTRGVVHVQITEGGIIEEQAGKVLNWSWDDVSKVHALNNGTAVISGLDGIIIPNSSLPAGQSSETFRECIEKLRTAK